MAHRILHVLDATTPGDSLDMLAILTGAVACGQGRCEHSQRIVALGHHSTSDLAALAVMDVGAITFVPSAGWADPTGWRGLKKVMRQFAPTHVHAWGVPAAVAVGASRFQGRCLHTFTDVPKRRHGQVLRFMMRWFPRAVGNDLFIASSSAVANLMQPVVAGMFINPPGIPLNPPPALAEIVDLRKNLGLTSTDGPVLLLGGEGPNAHYDLAIWTVAILQHLFPGMRAVVREDARHRVNLSLDRFFHTLGDERMLLVAPPDIPWRTLVQAADILLVAATAPIPVGSILAAMAAGVPVVSAPTPAIRGLLEHQQNGLIAASATARALAAELEKLLTTGTLREVLVENARRKIAANYAPARMVGGFEDLYVREALVGCAT